MQKAGEITRTLVQRHVDDIVLVDEGDVEQAIVMLLEIEKTLVEGAGAACLAAVVARPELFACRKVGLVLSGGNIDFVYSFNSNANSAHSIQSVTMSNFAGFTIWDKQAHARRLEALQQLLVAGVDGLREGLEAGLVVGILVAYLAAIVVLPALVLLFDRVWPWKVRQKPPAGSFTRARIVATDGHDLVGQPV